MMITPFTVVAALFIVFAWSRAILRFRDGSIPFYAFLSWSVIWMAALITISRPGVISVIAAWLGIGRGADLVIYGSIILVFYLIFRIYLKIGTVEHEITRLVRAIALKEGKGE